MLVKRILVALMLFWLLPVLSLADMCSWVDKDGVRHFSNTNDCPAAEASISPEAADSDTQADRNRAGLRFMGLYRDGCNYVRFYGDGTVLSVFSTGHPQNLASWFGKASNKVHRGKYSIHRDTVRFYTLYKHNIELAKGIVSGDRLAVAFVNVAEKHLNERNLVQRSWHYYTFVPIDFPRENRY